jgi:diguanylate cyclase (GGDEF)-like protein
MTSSDFEYVNDPQLRVSIERRILLGNLRRMQRLLWGLALFLALVLLSSPLLYKKSMQHFGSAVPLDVQILWRSAWLAFDLLALFGIRRVLSHQPERIGLFHRAVETGVPLINMLFVVSLLAAGYAYNPSLEILYIALFAMAPLIRLNAVKTLIVVGLPLGLLMALMDHRAADVAHMSNMLSLTAVVILAAIVFREMHRSTVREMEQQAIIERQLKAMEAFANTDGLTGLANRRSLDEHLETEWRRGMREHNFLAVVMLDIDLFKSYNDKYGHPSGDECIRNIASVIKGYARRAGDIAARYGGEEFVLVLPGVDLGDAASIAERIRLEIFSANRPHAGSPEGRVTVSVGTASAPAASLDSGEALLRSADKALYRAKAEGRNRVVAASESARAVAEK